MAAEVINTEFPFSELDSFLTPNDKFYVRSHFPAPEVNAQSWRLSIEGAVDRPFSLDYDELRALPARTVAATLECAGNSRTFLNPPVKGLQWNLGAVSNAEWTGVPLAAILEHAQADEEAVEVILEGADSGPINDDVAPPGDVHFAIAIPLERAWNRDTLIAHTMNGKPLPLLHGFPARALVPGYYAVASVKWLRRIIVTRQPFRGYYQVIDYACWREENGISVRVPLRGMGLKSLIAQPTAGETLAAGAPYRVRGAAWTADADIVSVECSWDGVHWSGAHLLGEAVPNAWRLWECDIAAPSSPGRHRICCRATDSLGCTQPLCHDKRNCNYVIHHVLPIEVEVR